MGVGAFDGDAEEFAGQDVAGGVHAADVCGAGGGECAVDALGAAEAELEDGIASGGVADAGGLGGDQGLEVDDVEEGGFEELGLEDRAGDADERLVGEDDGAFGDGVDVAGELQLGEIIRGSRSSKSGAVVAGERGGGRRGRFRRI